MGINGVLKRIIVYSFSKMFRSIRKFEYVIYHICLGVTQVDSKLSVQTLREDSAHHKDPELHRNPCLQTSS